MRIESDLPKMVKEFTYAKNCHYLKLTDAKGRQTTLVEHSLVRYWCLSCQHIWLQENTLATCCPACAGPKISKQWMTPQISLVPEEESDFTMPPKKKA